MLVLMLVLMLGWLLPVLRSGWRTRLAVTARAVVLLHTRSRCCCVQASDAISPNSRWR